MTVPVPATGHKEWHSIPLQPSSESATNSRWCAVQMCPCEAAWIKIMTWEIKATKKRVTRKTAKGRCAGQGRRVDLGRLPGQAHRQPPCGWIGQTPHLGWALRAGPKQPPEPACTAPPKTTASPARLMPQSCQTWRMHALCCRLCVCSCRSSSAWRMSAEKIV